MGQGDAHAHCKERPGVFFICFAFVRARKINTTCRDVAYVTEVPRAQITFFSLVICPRAVTGCILNRARLNYNPTQG